MLKLVRDAMGLGEVVVRLLTALEDKVLHVEVSTIRGIVKVRLRDRADGSYEMESVL